MPLPETEALSRSIVSLPMYPDLGEDRVDRVVDAMVDVLETLDTPGA